MKSEKRRVRVRGESEDALFYWLLNGEEPMSQECRQLPEAGECEVAILPWRLQKEGSSANTCVFT